MNYFLTNISGRYQCKEISSSLVIGYVHEVEFRLKKEDLYIKRKLEEKLERTLMKQIKERLEEKIKKEI